MDCRFAVVAALVASAGCFSDPPSTTGGGESSADSTGAEVVTESGSSSGLGSSSSGETTDVADSSTSLVGTTTFGTSSTGAGCRIETVEGGPTDVDIVMVADSSAAMMEHQGPVQQLLDRLSNAFPVGTSHRFIFMSSLGSPVEFCVPMPLGMPTCGDGAFPSFTHLDVDTSTPGNDVLGNMLATLDSGVEALRLNSQKHLIVVTSDDTLIPPSDAVELIRDFGIGFAHSRVHSISGGGEGCEDSHALSEVVMQMFGRTVSLCPLGDDAAFFAGLLAPAVSCNFDASDAGGDIEGGFLSAGPVTLDLTYVESLEDCMPGVPGATLLEAGDTVVLSLCPQTCAQYQDAVGSTPGSVDLLVCEVP